MQAEGEVTILCLVNEVRILDLGVFLTRGQSAKVAFSQAMKSRDLSQARMDGTVQTQVLRTSAIRQHTPLDAARVQERVSSNVTTSVTPRHEPPAPAMDLGPVLGALSALTDEVRALRKDMAANPVPALDLTPLVQALQGLKVTGPVSASVGVSSPEPKESEDLFIPGKIVTDVAPVNLDVVSEESDGGDVNDVAAALKKARQGR